LRRHCERESSCRTLPRGGACRCSTNASRLLHPLWQAPDLPSLTMSASANAGRGEWERLPQRKRLYAPLQPEDTADRTWGCRYSNPVACGRNKMPNVCAFVREDGICMEPPRGCSGRYAKLLAETVGQVHANESSRGDDLGEANGTKPR